MLGNSNSSSNFIVKNSTSDVFKSKLMLQQVSMEMGISKLTKASFEVVPIAKQDVPLIMEIEETK